MAGNIKGITVEIGGNTAPLQNALKDVNKTSRDLQSELREVNKQLKLDPANTNLLTQKQKLLAESITNTKIKLDTLKEAEKQVQEQFKRGEVSEEQYRALQREVIKTEQYLKSLEKQVGKSNVALEKISITAKKVGDTAGTVSNKMMPVTVAITAAGAAAIKMGSDYEESLNKVDVAFKDNTKEVEAWSKTTLDKFGIAGGTALDMAALFGDMATSMGLATDKAADMSMSLVGLAGDLASFKNIGIDQAQEALKGIFTGEGEALKTLGIVMTDTTLKEYALSKGIKKKYDEMTQSEKVQLRYNYVMEMTKNAQGDFARTSDGTANSTRVLGESIKELSTEFGQQLLPVITPIIQKATELIKQFSQLDEGAKKIILIILGLVAVIAPVAKLIQGISLVIGGVTAVISTISGAIGLLTGTLTVATPAATALAGAISFMTGPIGLTILAVTALVAGFTYLWKHCEGFRAFWINLWNSIKEITNTAVNALAKFFTVTIPGAWNATIAFFTGIPAWFSNLWASIKTTTESVWNGIKAFFLNTWNAILATLTNIINSIVNFVISKFDWLINGVKGIFNGFKLYFDGIWNVIKNVFLGAVLLIIDLVTGNFTKLKEDAVHIFNNLKAAFSQIWEGIKQVFSSAIGIIVNFFKAEWNGLVNIGKTIWNAFRNFMSNLWESIKNTAIGAWNSMKSSVVSLCNGIKNEAINIWNGLINWFKSLPSVLYNAGVNMFTSMKSGVINTIGGVKSAIVNGITSAINWIKSLPSQAYNWGKDMIEGMINGIKNMIGKIKNTVNDVANSIRRILHFSVPDEGPLRDYETWMPDFISGLTAGIEKNKDKLIDAVKGMAEGMKVQANINLSNQQSIPKNGVKSGPLFVIENFNNYTENDIEKIMYQAEFYRKKAALALGGK